MDLSHGFRISEIPMGKYMMDSAVKPVSYENRAQTRSPTRECRCYVQTGSARRDDFPDFHFLILKFYSGYHLFPVFL
jgi:hypothetical protein